MSHYFRRFTCLIYKFLINVQESRASKAYIRFPINLHQDRSSLHQKWLWKKGQFGSHEQQVGGQQNSICSLTEAMSADAVPSGTFYLINRESNLSGGGQPGARSSSHTVGRGSQESACFGWQMEQAPPTPWEQLSCWGCSSRLPGMAFRKQCKDD